MSQFDWRQVSRRESAPWRSLVINSYLQLTHHSGEWLLIWIFSWIGTVLKRTTLVEDPAPPPNSHVTWTPHANERLAFDYSKLDVIYSVCRKAINRDWKSDRNEFVHLSFCSSKSWFINELVLQFIQVHNDISSYDKFAFISYSVAIRSFHVPLIADHPLRLLKSPRLNGRCLVTWQNCSQHPLFQMQIASHLEPWLTNV